MGTLFEQPPRNALYLSQHEIKTFMDDALALSAQYKVSLETILKVYEIKELERRNNLYKTNGDILDEQLAGFGVILEKISESLGTISENIGQ